MRAATSFRLVLALAGAAALLGAASGAAAPTAVADEEDPGNFGPAWSPDGSRIAFYSGRDGNLEVYVMDADGKRQRRLTRNPRQDGLPSWSPDGRSIAFTSSRD